MTVPVVAYAGHLYGLTATGIYDIATYEGNDMSNGCGAYWPDECADHEHDCRHPDVHLGAAHACECGVTW